MKTDNHGEAHGPGHGPRLVVLVLGVISLTFLAIAVLEHTWLAQAGQGTIHRLHTIRNAGTALVVALLIAHLILRRAPPLLLRALDQQEPYVEVDLAQRERRRVESCSHWFVQMRWVAVVAAATAVLLVVEVGELLPGTLISPLLLTVGSLALLNLIVSWLLRGGQFSAHLLHLQVYADLAILNVLLHYSGGIENPFYILAVFHVMIAGILLDRGQCFVVATAAGVMFSLMVGAEWSAVLPHHTLGIVPHGKGMEVDSAHDTYYVMSVVSVFWGALLLTAYFVTRLVEQIRSDERSLRAFACRTIAEHRLLENALKTTATGLRVLDPDLRVRWANDRWREWFGAGEPAPLATDTTGEANDPPARSTLEDGKVRTTEIAVPASVENGFTAFEGQRYFRITTAPLYNPDGCISEIAELAQEFTQQKKKQARMMRTSKLAAIGELASNVAHEVNNPIAIVSAKARLLLSRFSAQVPKKVSQDLHKIAQLADRVAHIARGLLDYSRPSAGVRTILDVREPVKKALDLAKQGIGTSDIRIVSCLDGWLPPVIATANELEQVFLNLFLNAVDAMHDGGELRVSARCEPVPGSEGQQYVCIDVTDTGTGIPMEALDRVFEPFFTTKKEGKGTGLGLSICLGLVKSHGGEIRVATEHGRGSRIIVRLPAASRAPP